MLTEFANPRTVLAMSFAVRLCASAFVFERTVECASSSDRVQVPWPGDQHPVGGLSAGGADPALGIGVRSRLLGGIFTTSIPAADSTASNASVNCPGPVADQEPKPRGALPQAHQQVPGLLHSPRPSG
jgi:hypothetical protein